MLIMDSFQKQPLATTFTPLMSVQYGTIDVASGTTSDFKTLGEIKTENFI